MHPRIYQQIKTKCNNTFSERGMVPGVITWKAFTVDNICKQVQLCSVSKMEWPINSLWKQDKIFYRGSPVTIQVKIKG